MAKQDKIKEGIALHYCDDRKIDYYTPLGRKLGNDYADVEVERLHSQGVAIKVERELPKCESTLHGKVGRHFKGGMEIVDTCALRPKFTFEPLITEEKK